MFHCNTVFFEDDGEHGKEYGGENDLLEMANPPNLLLYGGIMVPT